MNVGGYLSVVRRWFWVLLAATILAGGAGYVVAVQQDRVYEAQARLLVGPVNTDLNTQRGAGQLALSYAQLITSQAVTEPVIQRLGLGITPPALADRITVGSSDVTRLITIRVTDRDPQQAAIIANALAEQLGVLASTVSAPEGLTRLIDAAVPPPSPVAPQVPLTVLLAAAAGLLAGLSLALVLEFSSGTVRDDSEVIGLTGAPLLGTVASRPPAATSEEERWRYQLLSARLEPPPASAAPGVILVAGTGSSPQSGVVAANLARAFADRGVPCILVDANSSAAEATRSLGSAPDPRLPDLLEADEVQLELTPPQASADPMAQGDTAGLWLIPAGVGRGVSKQKHIETVLRTIGQRANIVVVAAGAFGASPEPELWARRAGVALLVVPEAGARREEITATLDAIRYSGVKLAGSVRSRPVRGLLAAVRRSSSVGYRPATGPAANPARALARTLSNGGRRRRRRR